MNRIEVAYVQGEHPSYRTKALEGTKVGFDFVDQPREGLFKIWANTEGKEMTFYVLKEKVISWDVEIDKAR